MLLPVICLAAAPSVSLPGRSTLTFPRGCSILYQSETAGMSILSLSGSFNGLQSFLQLRPHRVVRRFIENFRDPV